MVAQADIQNLSDRLSEFTAEVRAWMRESDQRNFANSMTLAAQSTQMATMRADLDAARVKSDQVTAMIAQLDTFKAEVDRLRVKSERWDAINSLGVAVMAVITYLSRSIP